MNNFIPINFIAEIKWTGSSKGTTSFHSRIDNLTSPVSVRETELVIKIFPPKTMTKLQAQMTSQVNSKYLRKELHQFYTNTLGKLQRWACSLTLWGQYYPHMQTGQRYMSREDYTEILT